MRHRDQHVVAADALQQIGKTLVRERVGGRAAGCLHRADFLLALLKIQVVKYTVLQPHRPVQYSGMS